jgi:hypothetical protein
MWPGGNVFFPSARGQVRGFDLLAVPEAAPTTAPRNTSKALGPLAVPEAAPTTAPRNTSKALGPLAVAEQDILVARCRSRLG